MNTISLDAMDDCKKEDVITVIMLKITNEIRTSIKVNPFFKCLFFFNESP